MKNLLKYKSAIPLSGLLIYSIILILEGLGIIPTPSLQGLTELYADYSFLLMFIIIFIESIVYVGFYFPGQLLAVFIVIVNDFSWFNVFMLTVVSIIAVTITAAINYRLGMLFSIKKKKEFRIRDMLIAMLHINLIALYMFELGAARAKKTAILYAGLLNIPYYILLITGTFLIKDYVTIFSEDTYLLLTLLIIWSGISLLMDFKKNSS